MFNWESCVVDSQETLPHVDDGLFWGVGRGFIDDCPTYHMVSSWNCYNCESPRDGSAYQTSCFCPATLAAGRKASLRFPILAADANVAWNNSRELADLRQV